MPTDGEIDYSRFEHAQLEEALTRIDRDAYPLNYAALIRELESRPAPPPVAPAAGAEPVRDPNAPYRPNEIPLPTRLIHIGLSLAVIGYAAHGLWADDLFLASRRGTGVHFRGGPAVVAFLAMCAAAAQTLSVVLDHYDRRDNEIAYRRFAQHAGYAAFGLLCAAVWWQTP